MLHRAPVRRVLGAALAGLTLAATAGVLVAPSASALDDPMQTLRVQIRTGYYVTQNGVPVAQIDDKRRDSSVQLIVALKNGEKLSYPISPAAPLNHGGPGGDAQYDQVPWKLDANRSLPTFIPQTQQLPDLLISSMTCTPNCTETAVKPTDITSFSIGWTSGHNGWSSYDEWNFGGASIDGFAGTVDTPLIDAIGQNRKFTSASATLKLNRTPQAIFGGDYDGTLSMPPATLKVHASFADVNGNLAGGLSIMSPGETTACGNIPLAFTLNDSMPLLGTGNKINTPQHGWLQVILSIPNNVHLSTDPSVFYTGDLIVNVDPNGNTSGQLQLTFVKHYPPDPNNPYGHNATLCSNHPFSIALAPSVG